MHDQLGALGCHQIFLLNGCIFCLTGLFGLGLYSILAQQKTECGVVVSTNFKVVGYAIHTPKL